MFFAFLKDAFSVNCTFRLDPNAEHSGGFTMLVQGYSDTMAGPSDSGLGYGSNPSTTNVGISRSLVIEFDTFYDVGVVSVCLYFHSFYPSKEEEWQ